MLAGSIANAKLANSAITINGSSTSLGGSFNTASITAGTAGTSSATSGLTISVPYVTLNAYGIATAYGTHTHTISAANITTAIGSTTYAPYNANGYLPLNGGTLTGELEFSHTVANGACIKYTNTRATSTAGNWGDIVLNIADADGTAMSRMGIYGSQNNLSYLYIGSNAASGVNLRISSTALTWGDNTIWHAGNANKSDVAWTCSTLTIHSDTTSHGNIYLDNGKYIVGMLADGTTTANLLGLSNADQLLIGYGMRSTGITAIYGQTMYFRSAATVGPEIYFGCSTHNKDAATLYFHSHPGSIRNGIKIGAEYAASADRLNLVVYTSNVGASPYTPSWSPTLKVTYTGRVGIGLSAPSEKLHVDGNILSTGDQVVSSDLTKKTNLIPIDLKVEQIAGAPAVTFDWKTGGHSFGSIAQYWKDVLGEAVLGTEGNYALAYGQLALVNTIVEAREIDKLKARVAELEAEVKRLTAN